MNEMGSAVPQFEGSDQIGPYQLLAKLAEGGMGTVYLARMTGPAGFNKLAVVKELKQELVGSARFAKLFLDEARLAARLTHPNVVHTYGAGEDDGRLYIAMEYLDGQPWARVRHRLRANHALSIDVQIEVLADTLAGLHHAHELKDFNGSALNVVHCDMSPQNVFITYDGQVKVVDFGVARAAHDGHSGSKVFLGKVAYCAPEQARGDTVDRRADVFAVGVMLWEALAAQRFASAEDAASTLRARASGYEPRVRDVAPFTPPVLARICDRAMALSPSDRYSTAAEFRKELSEYLAKFGRTRDSSKLGLLVSNAFETERERIHRLIEERVTPSHPSAVRPVTDVRWVESGEPAENTLEADLSRLASVTRLTDESTVASIISASLIEPRPQGFSTRSPSPSPVARQAAPQTRLPLWVGVGTLVVGCMAFAAVWFNTQPPVPKEPKESAPEALLPAAHSEAAPPPVRQDPLTLNLFFQAKPRSARLFLDGDRLGSNPFEAEPLLDNSVHRLSAAAPGFVPEEQAVVFDGDVRVLMRLRKKTRRPVIVRSEPLRRKNEALSTGTKSRVNKVPPPAPTRPPEIAPLATVASEATTPAATLTPDVDARASESEDMEPADSHQPHLRIYDLDPY